MSFATELTECIHRICTTYRDYAAVDKNHDAGAHIFTCTEYTKKVDEAGLDATPEEVCEAILRIVGWDKLTKNDPWPGHPKPEEVVKYLRKKR